MKIRPHRYAAHLVWTGAAAGPVRDYRSYSREYRVEFAGKTPLAGSADPHFCGDGTLPNPEDLLVAALSACHMLSWLAECARAGIAVVAYEDDASGEMARAAGKIRFTGVVLRPRATILDAARSAEALALHERANAECFIANSVAFPVRHEAEIAVLA